jgi:hypothetical protein
MVNQTPESTDCERDPEVAVALKVPAVCEHKPGKFLGHTWSKNYERHACAICNEEISVRIENR